LHMTAFYFAGHSREWSNLMEVLRVYELASGQKLNNGKKFYLFQ